MLIDLNADLGEGAGTDADLMPLITSANISCGFHAGDVDTIAAALDLAKTQGVRVGAHPGYPDREHFGRREMQLKKLQVHMMCLEQLVTLERLTEQRGVSISHVKAHGALYHQVARRGYYADGLVNAVLGIGGSTLPLVGLPGSALEAATNHIGHPFIPEGFADRRYRPDGSLVPRTEPDALLHDPKEVVEQVEWLVRTKRVRTICVHGDTPGAVEFVRAVRAALIDAGHELQAFA